MINYAKLRTLFSIAHAAVLTLGLFSVITKFSIAYIFDKLKGYNTNGFVEFVSGLNSFISWQATVGLISAGFIMSAAKSYYKSYQDLRKISGKVVDYENKIKELDATTLQNNPPAISEEAAQTQQEQPRSIRKIISNVSRPAIEFGTVTTGLVLIVGNYGFGQGFTNGGFLYSEIGAILLFAGALMYSSRCHDNFRKHLFDSIVQDEGRKALGRALLEKQQSIILPEESEKEMLASRLRIASGFLAGLSFSAIAVGAGGLLTGSDVPTGFGVSTLASQDFIILIAAATLVGAASGFSVAAAKSIERSIDHNRSSQIQEQSEQVHDIEEGKAIGPFTPGEEMNEEFTKEWKKKEYSSNIYTFQEVLGHLHNQPKEIRDIEERKVIRSTTQSEGKDEEDEEKKDYSNEPSRLPVLGSTSNINNLRSRTTSYFNSKN